MRTVVLLGNFGATNIGDEALLESVLHLFRLGDDQEKLRLHILSSNPLDTQHRYAAKYHCTASNLFPGGLRSLPGVFQAIRSLRIHAKNCSHVIFGGGGLFTDRPRLYAVAYWWLQFWFVKTILKCPVHIVGQSFGPLDRPLARLLTTQVLRNVAKITVRDNASLALVQELHPLANVELLPDLAFAYPNITRKAHKTEEASLSLQFPLRIALSLRPWTNTHRWIEETLVALKQVSETQPIELGLFPMQMEREEDISLLEGIKQRLSHEKNIQVELYQLSSFEALSKHISTYTLAIGQRLHFLICALRSHVPTIAINYSSKVSSLLSDAGMPILTDPESEDIVGSIQKVVLDIKKYQDEAVAFVSAREKEAEKLSHFIDR